MFFYFLTFLFSVVSGFSFAYDENLQFDSDQAVMGIMGLDILHLRHFPFYMYGQSYLLTVEAYLAAPFLGLLGCSVFALKLPLLLLNAVNALLIHDILVKDEKLSSRQAMLAVSFYSLAFPICMSRYLAIGNALALSLFMILVLWKIQKNAWPFRAMTLALGLLIRPFVIYGSGVLFGIRFFQGRKNWKPVILELKLILLAILIFALLNSFAERAYSYAPMAFTLRIQTPKQILEGFQWLIFNNAGTVLAYLKMPLLPYEIHLPESRFSVLVSGGRLVPLGYGLLGVSFLGLLKKLKWSAFSLYLMGVSAMAVLFYLTVIPHPEEIMLIRYTALLILFPIGFCSTLFAFQPKKKIDLFFKRGAFLAVFLISGQSLLEHSQILLAETFSRPLTRVTKRDVLNFLHENHVEYLKTDYWMAYVISFLSEQKIKVSTRPARVKDEQVLVELHSGEWFELTQAACGDLFVLSKKIDQWNLCKKKPSL